jgi:hypothetical protein
MRNIYRSIFSRPLSISLRPSKGTGIAQSVQRWATGWMTGGFESRQGLGIFFFTTASRPDLGPTQLPIQWVPRALSRELKKLGREADHSPPSNAEFKNEWSYTPLPQYSFMVWCSVKAQGQLYLYLQVQVTFSVCSTFRAVVHNPRPLGHMLPAMFFLRPTIFFAIIFLGQWLLFYIY